MKEKVSLLVFSLFFIPTILFGRPVRDFSFNDLDGKTHSWADLKGQPLVVNIGSHWGKKCKIAAPELQRAYLTYKDKGVLFLGVFVMSEEKDIKKFVQEYELTFPVGKETGIAEALEAEGIPETIFISREGEIIKRASGSIHYDQLKVGIEEIIKGANGANFTREKFYSRGANALIRENEKTEGEKMNTKFVKGGAITSALAFAFCGQLPLILASFGLGSFTISVWFAKYRWLFLAATFIFLGLAFYMTYRNRPKTGPWNLRMLYGTAVISIGFIIYALVAN